MHVFLVPIRDERGRPCPGVRIEDCGEKGGLNGVDNGRIWLDRVRVPRENLLNRFADVAADGTYTSPIPSPSRSRVPSMRAMLAPTGSRESRKRLSVITPVPMTGKIL